MRAPKLLDNDNWRQIVYCGRPPNCRKKEQNGREFPRAGALPVGANTEKSNNFALWDMEHTEEANPWRALCVGLNVLPNHSLATPWYRPCNQGPLPSDLPEDTLYWERPLWFLQGTATFFTRFCKFQADEIMNKHGIVPIRLPAYHPELNASGMYFL